MKAKRKANPSGVRIVHNKLLGGWYVVRGPHQTPLSGRFNSKEEAQAYLRKKNPAPENSKKSFFGMRVRIQKFNADTWIESEEAAYPKGGKTRDGEARVDNPAGRLVKIKAGVSDTYFTIPATAIEGKQKIAGYLTVDSETLVFHGRKKNPFFEKGDMLTITGHKSGPRKGLSYPNGRVIALESGAAGGWDVYYGKTESTGKETSFYGFSVGRIVPHGGFFRKKNPASKKSRSLSVPETHQLKIARDTLKMHPAAVIVMGGPSHAEARAIIARLTGKRK